MISLNAVYKVGWTTKTDFETSARIYRVGEEKYMLLILPQDEEPILFPVGTFVECLDVLNDHVRGGM